MNTQAPKTVTIKSDNPTLLKAFWEDIEKLGYKSKSEPRSWKYIGTNWVTVDSKEKWSSIHISNTHSRIEDVQAEINYTLPADYVAAYNHMKEGMEWWIEKEKTIEYKVGDWIYINNIGVRCTGDIPVNNTGKIKAIPNIKNAHKWYYDLENGCRIGGDRDSDIRPATPEEIAAAQYKVVEIGDNRTKVTISKGKIEADGREIRIMTVKNLIAHIEKIENEELFWSIGVSITIAPSCSRKVTGVKVSELREILEKYNELNN